MEDCLVVIVLVDWIGVLMKVRRMGIEGVFIFFLKPLSSRPTTKIEQRSSCVDLFSCWIARVPGLARTLIIGDNKRYDVDLDDLCTQGDQTEASSVQRGKKHIHILAKDDAEVGALTVQDRQKP